ncbi:hypothetical protein HAZT_HAZT007713, partial [Hyalella azteca]
GHGEYQELSEEKEFFETTKKSENVICHFYREGFERCKIVDKHFALLCKKHIEAKFYRLNIRVLPTLVVVKDGKTKDYIIGFSELGNVDDFSTEMLEWRLARSDVIEYSGDLMHPPEAGKPRRSTLKLIDNKNAKTIRGGKQGDDSDDSDY